MLHINNNPGGVRQYESAKFCLLAQTNEDLLVTFEQSPESHLRDSYGAFSGHAGAVVSFCWLLRPGDATHVDVGKGSPAL